MLPEDDVSLGRRAYGADTYSSLRSVAGFEIRCLVLASLGKVLGDIFFDLDREEEVLFEYTCHNPHLFSMHVGRVCSLSQAVRCFFDAHGKPLTFHKPLCQVGAHVSGSIAFQGFDGFDSLLTAWCLDARGVDVTKIQVLAVVAPIWELIQRGSWRTVAIQSEHAAGLVPLGPPAESFS